MLDRLNPTLFSRRVRRMLRHLKNHWEMSQPTQQYRPKLPSAIIQQHQSHSELITSTSDSIKLASTQLHLLADLCEAHFTAMHYAAQQQELIALARNLANRIDLEGMHRHNHQQIALEFEKLCKLLVNFKKYKLRTEGGNSWSDIMRPIAKRVSYALKYFSLSQHRKQSQSQNSQPDLTITYTRAQRRCAS